MQKRLSTIRIGKPFAVYNKLYNDYLLTNYQLFSIENKI